MKRSRSLLFLFALWFVALSVSAQQATFDQVKVRYNRSAQDQRLVDKNVVLTLDDAARKVIVRSGDKPLDVAYDDVQKVIFEVTGHMRGGALSQMVGGLVGAAIAGKKVRDYWCYLEFKKPDGSVQPYLLEIDKESSDAVIEKMRAIFGDKVQIPEFDEAVEIDKATLKALQTKHDLKVDKKSRPLPELRPDKAVVVVVCPPLAARFAGAGNQFKLHANDRVIAVNRMGTYGFAYVDPGKYRIVAQTENASAIDLDLEAGKAYYFLQNVFQGTWKAKTALSRNTRELVMYELSGAWYSDWKEKTN